MNKEIIVKLEKALRVLENYQEPPVIRAGEHPLKCVLVGIREVLAHLKQPKCKTSEFMKTGQDYVSGVFSILGHGRDCGCLQCGLLIWVDRACDRLDSEVAINKDLVVACEIGLHIAEWKSKLSNASKDLAEDIETIKAAIARNKKR